MKKHLLVKTALSGLFATLCTVGIVSFPGCQKQDYDYSEKDDLDPALLNSPELEEYIIAGANFQQTLNIFKDEISKIDFSKLEFVENSKGEKVAHLPISVDVEKQSRIFKEQKRALFARYPQFASLTETAKQNYFRTCIRNSSKVNCGLLKLGINICHPMTKSSDEEVVISSGKVDDVLDFLSRWAENQNNEVVVMVFSDGSAMFYYTSANSPTSSFTPTMQDENGIYTYEGKQVSQIIHSQPDEHKPSQDDINAKLPGITYSIYYNGTLKEY